VLAIELPHIQLWKLDCDIHTHGVKQDGADCLVEILEDEEKIGR